MGIVLRDFLAEVNVVSCKACKTHFTSTDRLVSKEFQGLSGRAYLYEWAINIRESMDMEKSLTTGVHVIREISCIFCNKKVGWKYIAATEASQKYKVGKYILERAFVEDVPNEFASEFTEVAEDDTPDTIML